MLDPVTYRLERYLDLLSARQRLTASNVANADTPGYKTKDIDFHFELLSAVDRDPPHVIEAGGLPVRNDGNDVSIDREARMMAETAIRFNAVTQLVRGQVRLIRSAIQEGRGA